MSRPRVTAQHHLEPRDQRALCSPHACTTPGVRVVVTFDLHDHAAALELLERAVEDVRAQITQVGPIRRKEDA